MFGIYAKIWHPLIYLTCYLTYLNFLDLLYDILNDHS